jgi:hypothetical protein
MNQKKPWNLDVIVISGGGLKGMSYIGILDAIFEKVQLKQFIENGKIDTLCGSSIGSIICLGICLGYTIEEMKNKMKEISLKTNQMFSFAPKEKPGKHLLSLLTNHFSITDGKFIDQEIDNIFIFKKRDPQKLTFSQLYKECKMNLVVSGSNITKSEPVYFSYSRTPDILVRDAIRISTRIPIILPPVQLGTELYVDGDIFDSFPISGAEKEIYKKAKKGNMLGIMRYYQNNQHNIEDFFDYIYSIVRGVAGRFMNMFSHKFDKYVVKIPAGKNIDPDLFFTEEELEKLYQVGYTEGKKYLEKRGNPRNFCFSSSKSVVN